MMHHDHDINLENGTELNLGLKSLVVGIVDITDVRWLLLVTNDGRLGWTFETEGLAILSTP